MSTYNYCVRITKPFGVLRDLVSCWAERCERVAVYEHVGRFTEKTHIHMVLGGSEVCKKQLKNLLRIHNINTQGSLGGNKDWSFKEWDGDENACAYMTKGYIKYSFLKKWNDDDHDRWIKMWRGTPNSSADQDAFDDCFDDAVFIPVKTQWERDERPYLPTTELHGEFKFIRKYVRNFVFNEYGRIWNVQAINRYKMLVYSYCFRNNVMIPLKDEVFKAY